MPKEYYTVFAEPKWKWLKATGAPQEGFSLKVDIYDGPLNLGETRVIVPGEFLHYVLSVHGSESVLDRLQILSCDGRYYFAYDYMKPHNERGSMVLWYWTRSNLPGWANEVIKCK